MKKILCAALLIACCLLSLPFAMADETLTDGDWTFTVDRKGVVSLSGYTGEETSLTLPEVLGGYTVTRVANKAFQGNTAIKMVVIPDCYTSIGHRAFENCTRLQKLTLGGGISDWTLDWGYNGAFAGCTNLFEIDFAPGITCIGAAAFKNCTLLDMVILPDTVTVVADSAFENCELLDIVEVYGNIEAAAFKNCSYMSMLTIHNAENIGNSAFQGCTSIKKIVLPETLTAIGNEAFKGCSQLREMIIPDAAETVGFRAFADCLQLQKLVVGASVAKWQKDWGDSSAFGNCPALKDVTVKAGVTLLPTKAFRDCIRLQTVTLPEGMVTLEDEVFLNCAKLETVIFPATLQTIGNSAFNNCPALKTAALPKALVSIGNSAFRGTALTEVIIPAKTVTIGCYAFRDCLALTHVVLGEQVTNWTEDWGNNGAFDNCTALKTLVIESGVNSIGAYAFRGCTALESVEVPSTSICVGEAAFKDCTGLKDAVVYRGVIEAGAFENCTALESIAIRKVTEIGDNAFRNCPVLSGVSLPRTLIKLGNNAFRGCTALTEVVIPDSTTTIGCYVFMDCMGLKTAYVSNNVNNWGLDWGTSGVFSNCMGLEYVYFGDGLSKIPDLILKNCISLKGVYVPASVISVGVNALKDAAPECVIYGEAGSYAEAFAGESLHAFTAAEFPVVY